MSTWYPYTRYKVILILSSQYSMKKNISSQSYCIRIFTRHKSTKLNVNRVTKLTRVGTPIKWTKDIKLKSRNLINSGLGEKILERKEITYKIHIYILYQTTVPHLGFNMLYLRFIKILYQTYTTRTDKFWNEHKIWKQINENKF